MAFDDFASAEEMELDLGDDPVDEDLFDFPDLVVREPAPRKAGARAAAISTPAPPAPSAPEISDELLLQAEVDAGIEPAPPAPRVDRPAEPALDPLGQVPPPDIERAAEAVLAAEAQSVAYDPELDEDLFNFAELFTANEAEAGNDIIPAEALFEEPEQAPLPEPEELLEPLAPEPIEPFAEPELDAFEPVAPARTPAKQSRPAQPQVASPPGSGRRRRRASRSHASHSEALPPQEFQLDLEPANPMRNRMVMVFVIGFILTNSVLAVLAWRIGDNFKSTLDSVRAELADPRPVIVQQPAAVAPVPEQVVVQEPDILPPADTVETYETLELRFARIAIQEGRYHAARRRLYRLLANRDRHPLLADSIAQAEFMIANSYMVQAEALGVEQ